MASCSIIQAHSPGDMTGARELFVEYGDSLGIDLCFQGFAEELRGLPGAYAPPRGSLILARQGQRWAGCVALRRCSAIDDNTCEMKRLYVRPEVRGEGLGRQLAERIISEARGMGYRRMVLDTLASMSPAIGLYRALGFSEIPAYYNNPLPEARYFSLDL